MANSLTNTEKPAAVETGPVRPDDDDSVGAPLDSGLPEARADIAAADEKSPRRPRSISIGVRSLALGAVIAVLVSGVAALAWLYIGAQRQLDAQATESTNSARAEKVALDYAVNAATMNYKELEPWKAVLVAGTSPELNGKLTEAAKSMEQIMVPLEWTSTAEPLVAKVRSSADGIYVVDCFVSVQTKTVQAPEALQSTATYSVTIDSNNGWQITDVGGVGKVVGPR
jgi:Mce-associated membrane protein